MSKNSEHRAPLITTVRVVLALVPIMALLIGPFFLNRTQPFVLGLPFLMFWVCAWAVITAGAMGVVYWLDPHRRNTPGDNG